jgi:phosphate transport system substrate-binding protein
MTRMSSSRSLWLVGGLLLAPANGGCNRDSGPAGGNGWWAERIILDGSSTVLPLATEMGRVFHEQNPGFILVVESSGTTGGFRKFCAGKINVATASRPINKAEETFCGQQGVEFVEIPIAFDSLAVVVSARNSFAQCLTVTELKRTSLWRWSDRMVEG